VNSERASTLALVPARGGSKSIPRKNLAPLAGKPLIAWTIQAAMECRAPLRVVVSTDDEDIAREAVRWGAEVPFLRPAQLAEDRTPTMPVVSHALHELGALDGYAPQRILLLQPTSPLRTADDVDAAIALAEQHDGADVVSVTPATQHPHLMKRITADGLLVDAVPHEAVERRQDLEQLYVLNGAIYVSTTETVLGKESLYADRTVGYVMPPERSIDVDEPWDLHLCELILRERHARD
jgi:CMP-N,N'-diacetyllegionaminic acid synthase